MLEEKDVEKNCDECGAKLTIRTNKTTGHQFLGCTRWPECDHTEDIPESLRMLLAGQPTLF